MKKFCAKNVALAIASVAVIASLGSCGAPKGDITVCLASEPGTMDPALNSSVDGASYAVHLFDGLYHYEENPSKAGAAVLKPACAAAEPTKTTNADGSVTYDFTMRSGMKWSDGSTLDAHDFVYSWNRAASGKTAADYAYMYDIVKNASKVEADTTGTEKLGISSSDDGSHFFVTLPVDVPYFYEICAFPAMMPVQEATVEKNDTETPGTWATKVETYVSNGAYTLEYWKHNSVIVLKKNPNYWNAANVKLNRIAFALSDDASAMLANYKTGAYDMIDDMPTEELETIAKDYPDEYKVQGQLGTYYVCFNINSTTFSKADTELKRQLLRKGLSLLIDRNYICEEIGKAGQTPADGFVATGLTDADGTTDYTAVNGPAHDGKGYYSTAKADYAANVTEGIADIVAAGYTYDAAAKKFTDFPASFVYLYNTSSGHKLIGEYLQSVFATYGITMNLTNQEWDTFLDTRKKGDYDVARNGWLADYNDPISFLDMWTTESGNNDVQFGRDANKTYAGYSCDLDGSYTIEASEKNLTWAKSYDVIINKIKTTSDTALRYKLMHAAEDLLMSTGCICPLYNYTDNFLASTKIKGFFTSPLGYKFFMYSYKA
jgi:ABC-type oligopeptide transport system substrate-binding subunit